MTAVEGEINQIYAALIQFFKQNRSDMIQLENRVAKLEQNVNLLNWQNSIEYQMLDGVEYVDLDDASKIVCMVRDFYDITGGEWRTSDLLLLKTVMSTIDISPRGNIRYYDFIVRVAGDEKLLTKLLGGKHIQRLPETYLVPLLGIKKLELLDTDEAYIVETVENLLQSAGVVADRHKLENNLVQNYVAQEAQVNLDTEVNNYDLTMEMLFNLRFAEDSGLFLEEVVPEVQEVETEASGEQLAKEAKEKEAQAKAEEEKKKLEEDYKEAAELFKNAKFKQVYPLLKTLSNRGYARANALLYWLCYDEFNDKMAVTYAKKGYEAGDAIASIQYAFDCEIDSKKRKEIFEKYKPILWDQSMEGDFFATYMLAICWKNETDEDADEEKALELLLKVKEQGFYRAYYSTALLKWALRDKENVANFVKRVDFTNEVIDLIREAAEKFPEYKNPEKFAKENNITI